MNAEPIKLLGLGCFLAGTLIGVVGVEAPDPWGLPWWLKLALGCAFGVLVSVVITRIAQRIAGGAR